MNLKQIKKVVVLGATGSLGIQALEVLKKYKKYFEVIGLSANTSGSLLRQQAKDWNVPAKNLVLVSHDGPEKLSKLAAMKDADIVINVISGTHGIEASKEVLKAGKKLLLGNKESLISEGMSLLKMPGKIIPIDSEHNAIFEILRKFPKKKIEKIIIPCSGGPFWKKQKKELEKVSVKEVLNHPKWKMGPKISVESATLINKGMEVIEAYYLFLQPLRKIEITIHPECMVHGIVEFTDGEKMAYVSEPSMFEPIENALLFAAGMKVPTREIRKLKPKEFTFQNPNHEILQGINVVLSVFQKNPYKMKAFLLQEEQVIQKFLHGKIKFLEIFSALQPQA
jgi:1-deoxy-D-xylulose-5-phosphate reductoisomerase